MQIDASNIFVGFQHINKIFKRLISNITIPRSIVLIYGEFFIKSITYLNSSSSKSFSKINLSPLISIYVINESEAIFLLKNKNIYTNIFIVADIIYDTY